MDEGLAAIWKVLEEKGMADNTIFVFSSDNGPWTNFPERMEGDGVTIASHVGSAGVFREVLKPGRMRVELAFRLLCILEK